MNTKRFAVIAMAALGALLATAPAAQAGTTCSTLYDTLQTIKGDLNVPNNATCIFNAGVSVAGNTTVGKGATLAIVGGTITGNVQGSNCGTVLLISVTVRGNVQVGNCTGEATDVSYGAIVYFSTIGGNFQCHNNTVAQYACFLLYSQVIGNVEVMNNVSSSSVPSSIGGNTIGKNLQCQNNIPLPTNGGLPNIVTGNPNQGSEAQCKGF